MQAYASVAVVGINSKRLVESKALPRLVATFTSLSKRS